MSLAEAITFVLWSEWFDETSATIFVTQLRQHGCRVKMVGIGGMSSKGIHGVVLTPDLMVDQALVLAHRANCVVFPCSATGLHRLNNDPRIVEFLQRAERNDAQFLIGSQPPSSSWKANLPVRQVVPLPLVARVTEYPGSEYLVAFVRDLADSLIHHLKGRRDEQKIQ